jgi:hypothetical protein
MRKNANLIALAFLFICFISCKKETNNDNTVPTNALIGGWNFEGIQSNNMVNTSNGVNTTIFTSDYGTTGNSGTLNFTENSINGLNLGYTAITPSLIVSYQSGMQNDTLENTFSTNVISSVNSNLTYEIIGTDSIHFIGSGFPDSVGNNNPVVNGAKFSISGNILTFTSYTYINKMSGPPTTQYQTDTLIITLEKE